MTHEFTLILSNVQEITVEIQDALFKAGCGDALVGIHNGMLCFDFCRGAASEEAALQSVIAQVYQAGFDIAEIHIDKCTGGGGG